MSDRLGIAVAGHEVRAVLVRRGVVVWHGRQMTTAGGSPLEAIQQLLVGTEPRRRRRTVVHVALGPTWSQVKVLEGLPPLHDSRMVTRLVTENASAFFLRRPQRVAIAEVHRGADGVVWGAALDRGVLDEIGSALESAGLRLARAFPTVTALAAALPDCTLSWTDGPARLRVKIEAGELRRLHRILPGEGKFSTPTVPAALAALGDGAPDFLDAFAAAVAPRTVALAWQPEQSAATIALWRRARIAAAAALLVISVGAAAIAPGARAARFVTGASAELARTRAAQIETPRIEAELRRVSQALVRIEAFRGERGRVISLLGEISRVVPESTAIITLRVDSLEGSFVALAPRVTDVLPALADAGSIVAPRIVGSVTREILGTAKLERATIRFRRPRPRK